MSKLPKAPLGASLVVLSSLFYGSYGVWYTLMGSYFGAFTQATFRCLLTAAGFFVLAFLCKQLGPMHWRRDAKWFLISFSTSTVVVVTQYYAFMEAGVGIATALLFVGIVIGMFLFGRVFSGERYSKDKWLATVLGFTGIALIFAPTLHAAGLLALLAAFGSGFATGLNVVVSKKMPYSPLQTATIIWVLGLLANLPSVFIFGESLNVFHWHAAWAYLGIFVLVSLVASGSITWGVKLVEAGAAGILGLLEVVFGVLFGAIFFSERPNVVALVGIAAIMLAAAIPYLKDYNARRGTLEEPKT